MKQMIPVESQFEIGDTVAYYVDNKPEFATVERIGWETKETPKCCELYVVYVLAGGPHCPGWLRENELTKSEYVCETMWIVRNKKPVKLSGYYIVQEQIWGLANERVYRVKKSEMFQTEEKVLEIIRLKALLDELK